MREPSFNLTNLPSRLLKYYKYDDTLNKKRLSGEIYLSSPLDFNDPCDCRILPKNNIEDLKHKGDAWLIQKLLELGYDKEESLSLCNRLKGDDKETLKEVHLRQLEKVGILCLTSNHTDTQMWGYYADNKGFCIEYDKEKFLKRLLLGVINTMDYRLTKLLYEDKFYCLGFKERCTNSDGASVSEHDFPHNPELADLACTMISETFKITPEIKNAYLLHLSELLNVNEMVSPDDGIRNFIRHVLAKRFAGEEIEYRQQMEVMTPTLFFDKNNPSSKRKYFQKTSVWKHEKEFRIVVSLGGRKVIALQPDIIKNVYLGCDMPCEKIAEISYLLESINTKCGLFMMRRQHTGELKAKPIDREKLSPNILEMKAKIEEL